MVHPFRRTLAHTQLYCRQFQRTLFGLPRGGHSTLRTFHPICGARQHWTRHYQDSLRTFAQTGLHQIAQHVVIDCGLGHNDRFWWLGRCGIARGFDGISHREPHRSLVSPRSPHVDDFSGLRRIGSHRRYLQSPHRRIGFHHRGADDRLDYVIPCALAHLLYHGGVRYLLRFGRNHHVSSGTQQYFCRFTCAGHHFVGVGLRHFCALFHAHHECF